MEASGQPHAPVSLPPEKEPPIPLDGPQNRAGRGGEEKKKNAIAPAENRTPVIEPIAQLRA
jgi:hypothetical protein